MGLGACGPEGVPTACSGEMRLHDAVPAGSPRASGSGEIETIQGTRTMAVIPDSGPVEGSFEGAEEGHRARRRKAARIYGWIEGIFFVALVVLAALVLARFAVRVLPEYFQ